MKSRLTLCMVWLFVLFCPTATWSETKFGEWVTVSELDGITGYTRSTSLTSVDEVKAVGTVDAPVPVIEALVRDISAQPEYMFKCTEAYRITPPGEEITTDRFYAYNRTGMPWPADDRFGVALVEYTIDRETGAIHIAAREAPVEMKNEPGNAVRMPLVRMTFVITPIGENRSEVLYQVLADPGGNLPSFIVNLFSRNLGIKTIAGIREMVKKENYRGAVSVLTTTPWTGAKEP